MASKNGDLRQRFFALKLDERTVQTEAGKVLVRAATTRGKDRLQQAVLAGTPWRETILREQCFHPRTREPLFTDDDDLGALPSRVTEPLIDAYIELSAITNEEVEELEGN